MSDLNGIKVDQGALIAWHALSPQRQEEIHGHLTNLLTLPVSEWPARDVVAVGGRPSEYLLRGPDEFRVFFRRGPEGITVLDIVLQETLERYFAAKS
jgi:hypothetical protein